jgi:ClpP class serine protease
MSNLAHILGLLYERPWVILPDTLGVFIALAERQSVPPEEVAAALHFDQGKREAAVYAHQLQVPFEAVATRQGTPVEGSRLLTRRGGTAVLQVVGPITRRPMGSLSGPRGASIDMLATDLQRALDDPSFTSILLDVDSPGGEVNGTAEFSQMIHDARSRKPTWAYVSDLGASAAYWIASAAERIVCAETAALGSIGAVAAVRNPLAHPKTQIEFVSSVSPNKRPDPTTEGGAAQIQALVDSFGTIFVDTVARNRGVTAEHVLGNFGRGSLLVGREAVRAGLADALGSFEGALADLADHVAGIPAPARLRPAAATTPAPIAADAQRALPVAAETDTPITAGPAPERRGPVSSFMDRLRALVAEADVPTGSADQEAAIVTEHLGGTARPISGQLVESAAEPAAIPTATANELARLQSENARLRLEGIEREAGTFVGEQLRTLKAMPAEEAALKAVFIQAAMDDMTHGPVNLGQGQRIARTSLLSNLYAVRPTRAELTDEVLGESYAHVLRERQAPKRDANAAPDEARVNQLLAMTPLGRQELEERQKAGANGNGNGASHR